MNDEGEVYVAVISEFIATALFVFLGCGSVVAALASPGPPGPQIIMPIAMTFGISIMCLAYSKSSTLYALCFSLGLFNLSIN